MNMKNLNRRSFVKVAASSIAAIPVIINAQEESQKLTESDPTAIALGYKENGTSVDSENYPTYKESQLCSGCTLYIANDDAWGACAIFPGKLVAAKGWCSAYVPVPS